MFAKGPLVRPQVTPQVLAGVDHRDLGEPVLVEVVAAAAKPIVGIPGQCRGQDCDLLPGLFVEGPADGRCQKGVALAAEEPAEAQVE